MVAAEFRRVVLDHPHVFPLVAVSLPATAVALAPVEALLGALADGGLEGDELMTAFWALVAYITGALIAEAAAASGVRVLFPYEPVDPDPVTLPHVSRMARQLASCDYGTEYRRGLALLVSRLLTPVPLWR
jgi:hypothetical protein